MGLIHSRAPKKRDKTQARLADEERKQIRHEARHERGEEGQERLAEPREIAQYAANEAEALKMLGADDEAEMRAIERGTRARGVRGRAGGVRGQA